MGTLPPNPRRSVGQSPTTLPTGSGVAAFYYLNGDAAPKPPPLRWAKPNYTSYGKRRSRFLLFKWGHCPQTPAVPLSKAQLHFLREAA